MTLLAIRSVCTRPGTDPEMPILPSVLLNRHNWLALEAKDHDVNSLLLLALLWIGVVCKAEQITHNIFVKVMRNIWLTE